MAALADRHCVPCKPGTPPLDAAAREALLREVPEWRVVDGHHLEREYRVADFVAALALVNRIGAIAEEQNHHPDLFLTWGRVAVKIWTHTIDGLSEGDFIFAAKCDAAVAS